MNKTLSFIRWPLAILVIFCLPAIRSLAGVPTRTHPDKPHPAPATHVTIVCDAAPGQPVLHGLDKLKATLEKHDITVTIAHTLDEATGEIIMAGLPSSPFLSSFLRTHKIPDTLESLSIWQARTRNNHPLWILAGHDDRGLMYALLDAADRIGWATDPAHPLNTLKAITEKPYVAERAVSIYTMNRAYWESRFYDETYWTSYLDMLAKDRFNTLVVIFGYENGGFLAPCYPYFFNVEGFPDIRMVGLTAGQQQKNLRAFHRLIDMAHQRGIRLNVGIWDHIYRGGVQGGGIPGTKDSPDQPTPGLVWGLDGDNLIAYTKSALARFIKEFSNLDAIQFRMHDESGLKKEEQDAFWLDIFKMIKTSVPGLLLDLRAKELKESVIRSAEETGVRFRITTKYWMEQMGLPYHPTRINPEKSPRRHSYSDLLRYPKEYTMHWQLWNGGTTRVLLWGDPEYARRFAESSLLYDADGYDVNEPLATKMEAQPHDMPPFELLNPSYRYYDYEFQRYWHFFEVFGRIGYNPNTPPDTWEKEFIQKFGPAAAPSIEKALHKASWILPRIISSCYPYSGFPTTRGWAEKQHLGDLPVYSMAEGSDLMQFANPDEEARLLIEGGGTPRILPSANSRWLRQTASEVLSLVSIAQKNGGSHPSKEFISTVADLKILANLALYHARRITAAVSYRLYKRTGDPAALENAIARERQAIDAWKDIVSAAGDIYTGDLMMGVRNADLCGHWKDELMSLQKGLASLENERTRTNLNPQPIKAPPYDPSKAIDNHTLFQYIHTPVTTAPAGQPITIRLNLSSKTTIKWVHLRYRPVSQEEGYKTIPMTPTKQKGIYQATIPAEDIDPKYDLMYLFEVTNLKDKGAIFPDVDKQTPYQIIKLIR